MKIDGHGMPFTLKFVTSCIYQFLYMNRRRYMISTKAGALFKHFKSIKFEVTRLNVKIYGNAQTSNQKFITFDESAYACISRF